MFWSKGGFRQLLWPETSCHALHRQTVSRAFRLVLYSQGVRDTPKVSSTASVTRGSDSAPTSMGVRDLAGPESPDVEIHISPNATHKHSNNSVAGLSFEYEPPGVNEHSSVGEAGQTAHEERQSRQLLPVSTCYLSRLA